MAPDMYYSHFEAVLGVIDFYIYYYEQNTFLCVLYMHYIHICIVYCHLILCSFQNLEVHKLSSSV